MLMAVPLLKNLHRFSAEQREAEYKWQISCENRTQHSVRLQALEAIKLAAGVGKTLSRRLLLLDALDGRMHTVKLRARCALQHGCHRSHATNQGYEALGGSNVSSKLSRE